MYKNLLLLTTIFIFLANLNAQVNPSQLIDEAISEAKKQKKYVFVNYKVASCDLSKKLANQMSNPLYDSSYIVVDIVLPKEKAATYFTNKETSQEGIVNGFPFWYILDDDGNFIEMSYDANGNNIGYPNTKKKIKQFIKIVRKTSKLSENKLDIIANSFQLRNNEQLLSGN
ncbi:hypothetical protein [uncultured Tenacibaculum sp.]|uniref:hypothetical protein n=1 Tax=uncultured Tenacibaculum sp. TaxID=174713 RepID=UPI002603757F|nr:hypothetical protein [uncultured Tenacibaculum sp.]